MLELILTHPVATFFFLFGIAMIVESLPKGPFIVINRKK